MFWQRNCLYAPLLITWKNSKVEPILSMYGIDTYIWLILMVNVGKCTSPMGGKRGRSNFLLPSWRQHPPQKIWRSIDKNPGFWVWSGISCVFQSKNLNNPFFHQQNMCVFLGEFGKHQVSIWILWRFMRSSTKVGKRVKWCAAGELSGMADVWAKVLGVGGIFVRDICMQYAIYVLRNIYAMYIYNIMC